MEQVSIRQVAAWTGGHYDGPDLPVGGVQIDSRRVGRGDLFVALGGSHVDGHDYLGVTLDNPAMTLYPYRDEPVPLLKGKGPKHAHLKLKGKMLDDYMENVAEDLEAMRLVHTWKR